MKLFITLLLLLNLSFAALINGIALTVNEDPITLFEIDDLSHTQNISKEKATFELIRQILTKQVAKVKNISVSKEEISAQLEDIMSKNALTKDQFEQKLKIEGLTYDGYSDQLQTQRLQQKLIGSLTQSAVKEPTEKEKISFFELHKDEFSLPKNIELTQYQSNNPNALQDLQKSPLFSPIGVKIEDQTLNVKSANPQLIEFLLKHKAKTFTRIVPVKEGLYMMFYIKKFGARAEPKLKDIDKELVGIMQTEQRNTIINNFFQDEMNKAKINYIRIEPLKF